MPWFGESGDPETFRSHDAMPLREIIDAAGLEWMVFAVRPTAVKRTQLGTRGELADGWLCFQSRDERRRIAGVPDGWEEMTEGALLALLGTAAVAPPVRRSGRPSRPA